MAPSRYELKIVDWDVKPQHKFSFMQEKLFHILKYVIIGGTNPTECIICILVRVATNMHTRLHARTHIHRKLTLKLINCVYMYITAEFRHIQGVQKNR